MPVVTLPPPAPGEANVSITEARSVVVVGANGAGKTRLGSFVEEHAGHTAHRISAQRSLVLPAFVQPKAYDQAESTLRYGSYHPGRNQDHYIRNRNGARWGSEPNSFMLNDYESLLALLFADEAKRGRDYARAALATIPTEHPTKCKLDVLAEIWAAVMPHRTLTITDDRVQASTISGSPYEAKNMSDGERVAIYLIGQALCAPRDGVIIIDEPEIHLHRAVQALLWDQIEAARRDCTFVYITHDLEFAASRIGARKFWLRGFNGSDWNWEEIGAASGLPDALVMQVLGSRRPILFVEGDETSHDATIYTALYPDEHVVPRRSCDKVVEATKAMASLPLFHHLKVRGLVDRDRRGDAEIAALNAAGVLVADVAEVENLLCIPEAVAGVAEQLKLDPQVSVDAAQAAVLAELTKQRDFQALLRALAEIQFRLNGFGPKVAGSDAAKLEVELAAFVSGIDVGATVAKAKALFDDVLARSDYAAALRLFNCKGNIKFVASALNVNPNTYIRIVLSVLMEAPRGVIAEAMRRLIAS